MDQEKVESPKKRGRKINFNSQKEIRRISLTALMIALSFMLSLVTRYIPFLNLGNGGSISMTGLGLVMAGLLLGPIYGTITGMVYGFLSFVLDGFVIHWGSIFFDYLFASGFVGLVGGCFSRCFYKKKIWAFFAAVVLGYFFRYLSTSLSGALFFGEYAPEGVNPWFYSFILYNIPYNAASMSVVLVIGGASIKGLQNLTNPVGQLLR